MTVQPLGAVPDSATFSSGPEPVFSTTIVWSIVDPALPLVLRTPFWVVTLRSKLPTTRAVSSVSAVCPG